MRFLDFGRLRVPEGSMKDNKLYDEISFLDSALCEIEKVPNLILDLVTKINGFFVYFCILNRIQINKGLESF